MKFKLVIIVLFSLLSSLTFSGILPVATISKISGTAMVNHKKVIVGTEVVEGDEVRVGHKKDFVEIKYQNGHIIRLNGGIIKMNELNPKTSNIQLIKGTIFNLISKLTPNEVFIVKTKRAAMGVRGTKFYIQESKKDTYLCVCDGVVEVESGKNKASVGIDQDLHIVANKKLEVTSSSDMMRKMGTEVFDSMK